MVSEKMQALAEAHVQIATDVLTGRGHVAIERTVSSYRKIVRANQRQIDGALKPTQKSRPTQAGRLFCKSASGVTKILRHSAAGRRFFLGQDQASNEIGEKHESSGEP